MGRQVISISAEGTVSGLQVKPGKGFDLRALGPAQIERASEIVWCPTQQRWFVEVRRGERSGHMVTNKDHADALWAIHGLKDPTAARDHSQYLLGSQEPHSVAMFVDYDDAVACEIAVLDHWRHRYGSEALA